ncbi:16S rRNA (adenine(1518)-N(6)/adenine(1519)-N(6))-dimethyltransferase RsmA [Aromatoleum anaerobium]|uniref:Ribosomal RNA small subunit methyltransferase A n=1 Tax=Aromatoleum anaerobium TaxID=182180 RepID=A0ABX1PRR2_9RHOO|nr:16S rRNA (adenine(1518)-N(6)/adenine(1519)-N(6))-dimethyltransferase RsmA [Aromatoleum anaerobium]MCK0506893.1 16S rRNA (adenine(1518)-N(6)/adenine(1519)-N(6))-dimethyltransferase RsmA [Aromatoleum anaerobium]
MNEHRARKRFGQNFLSDPNIIRKIIDAIRPVPGETVVEIGPGLGAMTDPLVERLSHLHVVEIDRDLIARLHERYSPERLTIHEGDALKFDFATLGAPLRVVGNLPYNISTPLLFHLAEFAAAVRDMTFMLQKEVVMRMVAEPGTEDYGRLSVMLQYRFRMGRLFDVPPGAFRPAPKVTSSIVRMVPLPAEQRTAQDEALLERVVAAAFGQRRKTLRNTLREWLDEADFPALGIDPGLRGERLTVADYVAITNYIAAKSPRAPANA